MEQLKRKKRWELQTTLARSFFAHHPNCSAYDHHVFHLGSWRFCVGCSGLYFGIITFLMADVLFFHTLLTVPSTRFLLGMIFFIPAMIQIKWKSSVKAIKFLMRFSLGISTYLLLSFIYVTSNFVLKILFIAIFIAGVYYYNKFQGPKQLIECQTCPFNEDYYTCSIRYSDILAIEELEVLKDDFELVDFALSLQNTSTIDRLGKIEENLP